MIARRPRAIGAGDEIVVATHNPGKLKEFQAFLEPFGVNAVSAGSLGLPEPEEAGATFEENARIKAEAAMQASGKPALGDDSGFCVSALDAAPGIFSARWAGPEKDFAAAMAKVNEGIGDAADRTAWFVCALALASPGERTLTFRGEVWGDAIWPPRGEHGFGYDPIFLPGGHEMTFAEMSPILKDAMSHRAHAFRLFADACLRR